MPGTFGYLQCPVATRIINHARSQPFSEWIIQGMLNRSDLYPDPLYEFQTDYVCINECVAVDFLGRFERLHEDMKEVQAHIGIELLPLRNLNAHSPKQDFREDYTSRAWQLVSDHFAEDLNRFGYE